MVRISVGDRPHDQRGYAVSVLVLGVVAALIMVAGLVVDGGQKAEAASRAETVAAGAARAAVNAGAGATLAARPGANPSTAQAIAAAEEYLAAAGRDQVTGRVTVNGNRVQVRTEISVEPIFLSIIGIDRLRADGEATARLVAHR